MKYLCKNKYWQLNKEYNLDKLLYLMIDRPSYIDFNDDFIWLKKNNSKRQYHRDYDLPASCIYLYSNKICNLRWYKNNKNYRKNNKPAQIKWDGYKTYYLHNQLMKTEKP